MKTFIIASISWYQKVLSPDTGIPKKIGLVIRPTCIFYPTCSEYMKQAVDRFGVLKGVWLGCKRIMRCNPFHECGVDEIPRY